MVRIFFIKQGYRVPKIPMRTTPLCEMNGISRYTNTGDVLGATPILQLDATFTY